MLLRASRILLTVIVVALGTLALAGPATAATVTFDDPATGITYTADNTNVAAGATVTGYTDASTTVNIPDTIEISGTDYDVTAIDASVFAFKGLTAVNLGNNLVTIGQNAFNDNDLTNVTIPNSVTTIGVAAFAGNNLTTVTLGSSVATIGVAAFAGNNLTTVTLPNSVTTIGDGAFYNNTDLIDVTFVGPPPTTITDAGTDASLGAAPGLVVSYNAAYDDSVFPGGFTQPTWHGYDTRAVTTATVTFDLNGHGDPVADQHSTAGDTATEPTPAPTEAGWAFTGWYTDSALTTAYEFSTVLTGDLTLYAGWTAITDPDPGTGSGSGNGTGTGGGGSSAGDDTALPDTGSPLTALWIAAALAAIGAGAILVCRKA